MATEHRDCERVLRRRRARCASKTVSLRTAQELDAVVHPIGCLRAVGTIAPPATSGRPAAVRLAWLEEEAEAANRVRLATSARKSAVGPPRGRARCGYVSGDDHADLVGGLAERVAGLRVWSRHDEAGDRPATSRRRIHGETDGRAGGAAGSTQ